MIIVSQERDIIVNFDRIESIWINNNILDNTRCRFSIVAGEDTIKFIKNLLMGGQAMKNENCFAYKKEYGCELCNTLNVLNCDSCKFYKNVADVNINKIEEEIKSYASGK